MKPNLTINSLLRFFKLTALLFILWGFPTAQAQEIVAKANQFNDTYTQEKIYLHIDRPSYWANDDIWFKAYLKNTVLPNCNLYVELLNDKGDLIYKKTCWAEEGMAYGDIHLSDTLSSGMYQMRAYTNWMRNFDEQWFFRRDFVIWNLSVKDKPERYDNLKARKVDFQLMPEGGTFLAGVKNRVAFKAIDQNSKGIDVEGVVIDENGLKVASVDSRLKGMGSFVITPKAGMKYYAQVTCAGDLPLTVELPRAAASGVAISIDARDQETIHLEVNQQGQTTGEKFLLMAQTEGRVCYYKEIVVTANKAVVDIPKDEFSTGIVRFTLLDQQNQPRCERLIFVNHHDHVNLAVAANKTQYQPRENVLIDISAMQQDFVPLQANLSVSVYPTSTIHQPERYPENIQTRFLLSSELKGRIEEPAFYFKDDSLSTIIALDNLMLTHGYRYFEWKQLTHSKQPVLAFQPEAGIQLRGTVLSDLLHRPVANAKVLMVPLKSAIGFREETTDANGQFVFSNLFFTDTLRVAMRMQKENGKAVSGIRMDETYATSPKATILPITYAYSKDDPSKTVTYMKEFSPEFLNRKWHLSDTILLDEIRVKAWQMKKYDGIIRPYIDYDYAIDLSKSDNVYANILDALEMNSPYYRAFTSRGATLLLDGIPEDPEFPWINDIPLSFFDRVEFVRMAPIIGKPFTPGIYFYTKRGFKMENVEMSSGIVTAKTVGFSVIRNYYTPRYDGSDDQQNDKSDFRSSLYWNPVVQTNSEGMARLSFYNSDQPGPVKVVVEGVAEDGKVCKAMFDYEILPKGLSAK